MNYSDFQKSLKFLNNKEYESFLCFAHDIKNLSEDDQQVADRIVRFTDETQLSE